jgi:hypothetical protein
MRDDMLPAAIIEDHRNAGLVRCIFIESNEVAECNRKASVFVCLEGVPPTRVFKPGYGDGEAERIQTGIEQGKIVGGRREPLVALLKLSVHIDLVLHCNTSKNRLCRSVRSRTLNDREDQGAKKIDALEQVFFRADRVDRHLQLQRAVQLGRMRDVANTVHIGVLPFRGASVVVLIFHLPNQGIKECRTPCIRTNAKGRWCGPKS